MAKLRNPKKKVDVPKKEYLILLGVLVSNCILEEQPKYIITLEEKEVLKNIFKNVELLHTKQAKSIILK